ncbi:MAG: radical SAM protein [Candidatus Melainabacteria bacterium]|nr:radical SAM protein [Candidatus Melainabacteria bacterium]
MITYLKNLKEKVNRQVGSDVFKRVVQYQGAKGLVNLVNVSVNAIQERHPPRLNYLPPCLFVEITNRCNLACPTCLLGTEQAYNGYNKSDIAFEQFKNIIDQIPSLVYVTLQGVGEPLLNKDIVKMIAYCSQRGISTYINTNGTVLTETKSKELIEARLSNLSISVNSFDEKVFAETRSGASIKKISENIKKFIQIKQVKNTKKPIVSFRAILMKETEPYMEDLIYKSDELGVDVLYIQLFMSIIADKNLMESSLSPSEIEEFSKKLETWKKKVKLQIITESFGKSSNNLGQCNLPWFSPNVTAEGFVTPCCTISNPNIINMGNIFNTPFEQIWNSEKFVNFRANFYDKQPKECVGCHNYKVKK